MDIIVIDSVAALTPQAEIEGDMGDAHVGLQARLMSQALRKLTGTLSKSKTILVFINQIRMKIGVMFGNPETTTGGNALKFYASVRLEVRKIETIEKGEEEAVGNKVRVKVVKNKVAPPFRKVELEIMFGKGISWSGSLIDAAVKYEVIDKKGAWYTWGEEKVGQGRDNAKLYHRAEPRGRRDYREARARTDLCGPAPGAQAAEAKPSRRRSSQPAVSRRQGSPKVGRSLSRPRARTAAQAGRGRPKPAAPHRRRSAEDEGLF